MAGLTKEQRAAKLLAQKIVDAGLTQEQFDALSDEDKANLVGEKKNSEDAVNQGLSGDGGAPDEAGDAGEKIKFVRMTRDPDFYDAPHEANVHPYEVSNYARGGWELP